jgi:hypothetical protein
MTDTTNALPPMPRTLDAVEPAPAPVEDTKRWWQSKGVIGAIIVILVLAARQLGYEITGEDQTSLTDGVVNLAGTLGALLSLVGRLTATKQVASK